MRRLSGEAGAVGVLVAFLMVGLLGFAAIVVDVGALYAERRQLQSGADAAALAVAADCAVGSCDDAAATAAAYADGNANDATSQASVAFPTADSVTVTTTTREPDGSSSLAHRLAPVLGHEATTVRAAATAAWSGLDAASTVPLIVSLCEWGRFTQDGTSYSAAPFTPSQQQTLMFHDGNADQSCGHSGSGADLPGGFGWLDTWAGCETALVAGGWADADPGNSTSKGCGPDGFRDLLGTTVAIPVFDQIEGQGNNGRYRVRGFAAFHLTSYRLSASKSWNAALPGYSPACGKAGGGGNDERCLGGHFTRFVDLGGVGDPDAPDLGGLTVQLTS